ncbi:MAG: serine/threonine-protein kinase [Kofleriaceae bacterium]
MYGESPRTLGKYRLIAEIARGGMGIVYLAMLQGPSGFSKLLVVKELKPELVEEPAFLQMFLEEARLAARLNHSNIVQTNEVGNDGDRYYMAMDYLDGRGLERMRRRARHVNNPLDLTLQLRVLCDVLAGLEYAHTFADFDGTPLGIVHRDVSPQNVFITFEGQVKLLDFGIAKTIESANETRAGVLKGKLGYMAPEQARGERVDARADVFGVGVMLWEALTGKPLRQGQTEHQILGDLIAKITPPRASSVKPDVPPELDDICARALAPDRADRYHSAGALQVDLEAYLVTLGRPITSRDLGSKLRELFHDDRARTSSMIESYVAKARAGNTNEDDDLPIIDVSYSPADGRTPVSAEQPVVGSNPGYSSSGYSKPSKSNISAQRPVGTLDAFQAPQPAPPPAVVSAPSQVYPAMPAKTGSSKVKLIALPAVMVVGVLLGGVLYSKSHSPATQPTADVGSSAQQPAQQMQTTQPAPLAKVDTPAPSPGPANTDLVEVRVKASPAVASIEIDGAQVIGNPFKGRYKNDGAMHQVKVSAPGHVTRTLAASFDQAVNLDVQLDKVQVARPQPVAQAKQHPQAQHVAQPPPPVETTPPPQPEVKVTPPPPPPQKSPTEVDPNGGSKPHHQIDTTNPYGK